jgi:hypothetical protein
MILKKGEFKKKKKTTCFPLASNIDCLKWWNLNNLQLKEVGNKNTYSVDFEMHRVC